MKARLYRARERCGLANADYELSKAEAIADGHETRISIPIIERRWRLLPNRRFCEIVLACTRRICESACVEGNDSLDETKTRKQQMKATKYIVWIHHNEGSSTGTAPMSAGAARKLKEEEERGIMTPRGTLPPWPKIEIRKEGNPPRTIAK